MECFSPCKINLLLNVLGKRSDGFHELETVLQPIPLADRLEFERSQAGVQLRCDHPDLPCDSSNLVYRAAAAFQEKTRCGGVRIFLEKKIPLAAGLGGGSSNAAHTLLALNELFSRPLSLEVLAELAVALGSDVPFFLQNNPALGTGRGERIEPLEPFAALRAVSLFLVHPGFGVPTAWAYRALADFPEALHDQLGRAAPLIEALERCDWAQAAAEFYNALEKPVLAKYPLLELYQQFFRANGALATLMSGSGSSTFAVFEDHSAAVRVQEQFKSRFGDSAWTVTLEL